MQWISVKDRLPEDDVIVICEWSVGGWGINEIAAAKHNDRGWIGYRYGCYDDPVIDPIRWMPLPEPPAVAE